MLKQNRDLFYFWVCSWIYTLPLKYFSCFRRLILNLSWKSNDRGGLKFWTCLYATLLLAVKYSAELNKYILLVRVISRGTFDCPRNRYFSQITHIISLGHQSINQSKFYLKSVHFITIQHKLSRAFQTDMHNKIT